MPSTLRNLTVTFGLVNFPAALRKASEKQDVTFDTAVRIPAGKDKDDQPVYTYERVTQVRGRSSGGGSASLGAKEDIVKGVWVDETTFNPLPEGALEKIADDTKIEGIEIEEFIALKDLPTERIEGAYYLAPQKGLLGAKPMRMLRDALRAEKVCGLCKLTLKGTGGRQRLGVIREANGRLVVNLLAFAADWRQTDEAADALENVEIPRQQMAMMRQFVKGGVVAGADSKLLHEAVDDAVAARERLYADAFEGDFKPVTKPRPARPQADDLMEALEASLREQGVEVPA